MLKILKYLEKKDWAFAFISVIFIVLQVWLDLRLPDYMSEITRLVQTEGSEISAVLSAGSKMLLCALGSLVVTVIVGYFVAQIAARLSRRLRRMTYEKTISFSMEEMNKFSTSSLITRSTNDITQIQSFISMGLQALVKAPIMAILAIIKIYNKSWQWTTITAVAVVILLIMISTVMSLAIPRFRKVQQLTDNLNRVTRESLTGIRVVRAYDANDYQQEKFGKANDDLTNTNLFTSRLMAIMSPTMSLIMSGLTLGIYWVGVYIIESAQMMDKLTVFSDMVVFSSYSMQVIMAFMMLSMTFIILPRATVSANRINEVLDQESKIVDGAITESDLHLQGEIEFNNVSFKYPDAEEYVLHDISFKAKKGETVAFIGSTGSGKSTIMNLIPRFYDVTEGEIKIDNINIKDYTQEALHNKLGYVSQRAVMFKGTIASNVAYGENGKENNIVEDIDEALEIAQASEFVNNLELKAESPVAQGGTNYSGGQKQRLSIARAIYRKPEIYLFDDSFSALDYKTDKILRKELKKKTSKATTLIVAQRIGTIIDADKIIVLDEGRIVGTGTHKELLDSCSVYREIAESQLSKEELENA